jgi:hypothetical protein
MSAWDIGRLGVVALAFGMAWCFALSPLACIAVFSAASALANFILFGVNAAVILRGKLAAAGRPQPGQRPLAEAAETT